MKKDEGGNICFFSQCRKWRYVLRHSWALDGEKENAITWIGLNPSTADENQLDPTLRRIKGYSKAWGYNCFYMLNAFAFRATDPNVMKKSSDPIGPENDKYLLEYTEKTSITICAWGANATFLDRNQYLLNLLKGKNIYYLELTKDGIPKHPLYLKSTLTPKSFNGII